MFVVFLRFTENKPRAQEFMSEHNAWVKQGLNEGLFLVVGSLDAGKGGCIIARGGDAQTLQSYISRDPFVFENIVVAEIHPITPSMASDECLFLMNNNQ